MKFTKPPQSIDLPQMESEVLAAWKRDSIFERSISEKPEEAIWSFYDGPPFATGLPHHGHLLAGTIKDVVPRYWSMRGKRIDRRFGWDCHGLPIEFEVEKALGLGGRKDIEEYGVDKFNEACRGIVLRYTSEWQTVVERLGRWVDFENDYKTMDLDFMESVWAIVKKLWDRGLIYEDKKVLPYSTRITTPISNFESNLNYQDVQDPSVTVKLAVKGETRTFILIWTTTPWTLPANLAVAVHPDFKYVKIRDVAEDEFYYVGESRLISLYKSADEYEVVEQKSGRDLVGVRYEQLIPAFAGRIPEPAHQILAAEYVTDDTGTGLVHIAPNFGEDDFLVGKKAGIEPLDHLDEEGIITDAVPLFEGKFIKDADKDIIRYLKEKGLLFRQETYQHSYPFCYRSDTPLIYRAISTWFVNVTQIKEQLIANNQEIHWVPEHLKDGRFGLWLDNARDWAISRNRFWGNPIPIWENKETGERLCVGSRRELEELTGQKIDDLHKHFIDDLVIRSPRTGDELRRIPHVLDCWFESGSMPYAQQHYPFSMDDAAFDRIFPAEFIAEGLDQTRGWFYTLLVLSTALEKGPPFRNVIVNGTVLAKDGRKMSKRLKNYTDPTEIFDEFGADTLRVYLLQSGAVRGEDLRFTDAGLKEITRKVLLPLWNAYSFLATYAAVDGWDPALDYTESRGNQLDQWIEIKLTRLEIEIKREMERFQLSKTVPPLLAFLDDLTNWYIRRSRRRFWKSENDSDKNEAYSTLYRVLAEYSKLAAPFTPFLTERIYQGLRLGHALAAHDSVHLDVYPDPAELTAEDLTLETAMDRTRDVVDLGRELREKLRARTRQPLATLFVGTAHEDDAALLTPLTDIVREELNVKSVRFIPSKEMAHWVIKPNFKLLGKRLGSRMKEFQAGLRELKEDEILAVVDGSPVELCGEAWSRDAFQIDLAAKDEFEHPCHSAGGLVVALDTTITEELRNEGFSRELINRVQRFRKDSGLAVEDRIELRVTAPAEMTAAFDQFVKLIEQETLSQWSHEPTASATHQTREEIEGQAIELGIAKIADESNRAGTP